MTDTMQKALASVVEENPVEIDLQEIMAMVELVRYLDQGLKVH